MAESASRKKEILKELTRFGDTAVSLLRPVIDKPDFPLRVVKLANFMRGKQSVEERQWEELALWGRQLATNDPKCTYYSAWALNQSVPAWQFSLSHNPARNTAYQKALQYFVKPGMIVLEIGTGCGLFALMAAKAGASHVYTCEQNPVLAKVAEENIRQNGYDEKITVIPKKSRDLRIGIDLPKKADLLLHELINIHLLHYDVLTIIADVRPRLLQPQAVVVPEKIAAWGVLVGGLTWRHLCRVDTVCGFDLSALNQFFPPEMAFQHHKNITGTFCEPFTLFSFDLSQVDAFPAASRQCTVLANRKGRIEGLVFWIRVDFHETISFEGKPPTPNFVPKFHAFPEAIPVRPGDRINLHLEHDRQHIFIRPVVDR